MALSLADPALPADLTPIFELARAAYPREVCGVILQGPDGTRTVALPNAALAPRLHFSFELNAWLALQRDADRRGERITCVFHSHPDASAALSGADQSEATAAGRPRVPDAAQLVISVDAAGIRELRLHRWNGAFFAEVARAEAAI